MKPKRRTRADWSRRDFITTGAASAAALVIGCSSVSGRKAEIIDCHTHFYDPTRPQGVPWPRPGESIYRTVLPQHYKAFAQSFGITGTVVVEASAWFEDNRWLLELAQDEPFIVGIVGNLIPGAENFPEQLSGLATNRLFRGIRVSGSGVGKLVQPNALRDLGQLVDLDLSLDTNGGVESLAAVSEIARAHPKLRIVIDHVANVRIDGAKPPAMWQDGLARVSAYPNVYCKVSGLVEGSGRRGAAPKDIEFYRPVLDHVWHCFGPRRVIYGSNWPVSELFADFATVHGLVERYATEKGAAATRAYFAENAASAYKWWRRS